MHFYELDGDVLTLRAGPRLLWGGVAHLAPRLGSHPLTRLAAPRRRQSTSVPKVQRSPMQCRPTACP